MKINIRKEEESDYPAVFELVEKAFDMLDLSDHQEQFLVQRLRNSDAFVPELSLVAELDGQIIGFVLLTKITIVDGNSVHSDSLALAPVAVLPAYQNKGIGGELIVHAHSLAKNLGFKSIVLLGHENYYPRFGYSQIKDFGIKLPFDAPDANSMVCELVKNSLQHVKGVINYPKEFEIN